jgi:hypothetical protein
MKNKFTKSIFGKSLLIIIAMSFSGNVGIAQVIKKDTKLENIQKPNWREFGGNRKDITFMQLQNQFKKDWEGKKPQKGVGIKVFKRWEDYMAPRVYPSGDMSLPSNTYSNYIKWEKGNASQNKGAKISAPAAIATWTELGQLSKPTGYDAGVGRVDFIKFSPTDVNTAYVSTPDGGLWKTSNLNASLPSWTTNSDFLPVIGTGELAIAPDGTTMYLATGSWEGDKRSAGILKSTDGGATWNPTILTFTADNGVQIRRLQMDPTNPLVMLAATNSGLYRTTDGWTTQSQTLDGFHQIDDIKFKPGNNNILYASGRSLANTNIFWKSLDNGVNWLPVSTGLPSGETSRVILAVTPAQSDAVYLLAGNNVGGYQGLYYSGNSGTTFSTRSTSPNILNGDIPAPVDKISGQATHDLAIAVSPTDVNMVTVGGISQYRSTDGGVNWTLLTYWYGSDPTNAGGNPIAPYIHADVQSLQYAPGSSTTLYTSSDGGIYRSTDNGVSWTDISNNLRIAQQTDVANSGTTAGLTVAGLQDIGVVKTVSGVSTYIGGGDGETSFIDRTNDMNIVASDAGGTFRLSTDGGSGFSSLNGNGLPGDGAEFNSQIIQDPVIATTCYGGGRPDLYKCTNYLDAASNTHAWTSIGTPSGTGNVLRFAISAANTQIIYTLKQDAVSKTINGGGTWTNVSGTLPVGSIRITNIAISNTDPNKVWVVFSGYSSGEKVFKTIDGGTTWTDVSSASLPNIPINTIVYRDNSATDEVYIGADIGVFVIDNNRSTWEPYFNGLARSRVTDLEIFYPTSKIRASTYGRGSWENDLAVTRIITASAGANGSIAPTGTVGVVSGANKTFTVTPITGYSIDKVLVDNVEVPVGGGNVRASAVLGDPATFTFNNVTTTHTISATFKMDVLPVTLISFEAKANTNNQAQLKWVTANEVNFEKFEIEKSADASTFKTIGQVKATGENKYTYLDETPIDNTNYYRLKMIDLDGKFNYSKVIAANVTTAEPLLVYPNPAKDQITIDLNNPNFSVDLLDATGKNVFKKSNIANKITISTKDVTNGLYFVKVRSADGKFNISKKVSVVK